MLDAWAAAEGPLLEIDATDEEERLAFEPERLAMEAESRAREREEKALFSEGIQPLAHEHLTQWKLPLVVMVYRR